MVEEYTGEHTDAILEYRICIYNNYFLYRNKKATKELNIKYTIYDEDIPFLGSSLTCMILYIFLLFENQVYFLIYCKMNLHVYTSDIYSCCIKVMFK